MAVMPEVLADCPVSISTSKELIQYCKNSNGVLLQVENTV